MQQSGVPVKRLMLVLECFVAVTFANLSMGNVAIIESFSNKVAAVERIARVRIIERKAIFYSKKPEICGHLYRTEVIETLKGEASNFSFSSASEKHFMETGSEYLILVYKNSPEEDIELFKFLEEAARDGQHQQFYQSLLESIRCNRKYSRYHIGAAEQTAMPIDGADSQIDAFIILRDDPFRGIADQAPLNLFWDIDIPITEVRREGKTYWRVPWSDAREMILREVAGERAPRRPSSGGASLVSPEDALEAP